MAALIAIAVLAAAPAAGPTLSPSSYELPAGKAASSADHRIASGEEQRILVELPKGPAWTYRSKRGAVVEIAALGGELKEAPKLAHVALNWKF